LAALAPACESDDFVAIQRQDACSMTFRPLHDRVLVRRVEAAEKTTGGIIIPDTAKEKPQEGEVVSAGSGICAEDGTITPAGHQGRRQDPVRQMVGHRGQARWRRSYHHERKRRSGRHWLTQPSPISLAVAKRLTNFP